MFHTNAEQLNRKRNNRYKWIQEQLSGKRKEIDEMIRSHFQKISANSKYKQHKAVIEERKKMTNNFISYVNMTFFAMLGDKDYVHITPWKSIQNRIEQYKKNVNASLQKLTLYLDGRREEEGENERRSKSLTPSKNKKISKQQTVPMLTFFIHNAQNPYPNTKEKQQMKKQSVLDLTQINTWLTNYRDRHLRPFFQ